MVQGAAEDAAARALRRRDRAAPALDAARPGCRPRRLARGRPRRAGWCCSRGCGAGPTRSRPLRAQAREGLRKLRGEPDHHHDRYDPSVTGGAAAGRRDPPRPGGRAGRGGRLGPGPAGAAARHRVGPAAPAAARAPDCSGSPRGSRWSPARPRLAPPKEAIQLATDLVCPKCQGPHADLRAQRRHRRPVRRLPRHLPGPGRARAPGRRRAGLAAQPLGPPRARARPLRARPRSIPTRSSDDD